MPSERQVALPECLDYIQRAPMERRIRSVIVHHTWRPTAAQYQGLATVRGVRHYHMQVRGWSDNGYHIMIGPPGDTFLCRPLARVGAHCRGQNQHSVGLAYIANFDEEDPAQYRGLEVGQKVVAALLERFDLEPDDVHFHREYANKTCPGTRLHLDEYRHQVAALITESLSAVVAKATSTSAEATALSRKRMAKSAHPCPPASLSLKVVLLPGSQVIDCHPYLEGGITRVDLRPVAEALGCEVYDHIADQGKVYVRRKVRSLADLQAPG